MDESRDTSQNNDTCEYFIGLADWDAQVGDPSALVEALSRVKEQLGNRPGQAHKIIEAATVYPVDKERLADFKDAMRRDGFTNVQVDRVVKILNESLLAKPVNYAREEGAEIPVLRVVSKPSDEDE